MSNFIAIIFSAFQLKIRSGETSLNYRVHDQIPFQINLWWLFEQISYMWNKKSVLNV